MIVSMPYRRVAATAASVRWLSDALPCASLCADVVARPVARLDLRQLSRRAPCLDRSAMPPRPPPITARRSRADPKNSELLDRAFVSVLADGDIEEAGRLAERVLVVNKTDRIARLVAGVRALKQKQYGAAQPAYRAIGARTGHRPDRRHADRLDARSAPTIPRARSRASTRLTGADWYALFKDLHTGLILRRDRTTARKRRSVLSAPTSSTTARCASCNPMQACSCGRDRRTKRSKVLETFDKALPRHPLVTGELEKVAPARNCRR